MKNIIKAVFSVMGLNVSRKADNNNSETYTAPANPYVGFDYAVEGYDAVNIAKDYSMLNPINLLTLFEQAVYCETKNIEGDFVECGVWKGGAVGVMAKANLLYGTQRRQLHLFDAFDDICPPDAEVDGARAIEDTKTIIGFHDVKEMKGQLESIKGAYDTLGGHGTIAICNNLLMDILQYPEENIHFHKGWFQNTIPIDKNEIDKIAILRLDGDWYDSIKVCLEHLYDKVVKGGLVVIDDYGYYEGCTKAVDEFLVSREVKTFLSYSKPGCRYFVKPDKGINE